MDVSKVENKSLPTNMCDINDNRATCSTPSSVSDTLSTENTTEDSFLPSSLAAEELQLALNKEANEDELNKAIIRCRDLVLESEECSMERKWLVRHLIELRLRLQECKEALLDPEHPRNKLSGTSMRTIRGHHLHLQPLFKRTASRYCDHCTGTIWTIIQAWYECEDCGYACHHKCLATIVRECAHVVATEKGFYEIDICPESGLSAQKYECAECKTKMLLTREWPEARRCDYTGLYFCSACHWGSSAIIPARVIHNWDFKTRPVCQASLQQLRIMAHRPLIHLESLNSRLFTLVHELSLVRRLRLELNGMRRYLSVCRRATDEHLLWKSGTGPHLFENTNMYSLQDLVDVQSGELPTRLHALIEAFSRHIKTECEVCRGRGHICEVCSNDEVLFPFDALAVVCKECGAVLHKHCLARKKEVCPKCKRIEIRKEQVIGEVDDEVFNVF